MKHSRLSGMGSTEHGSSARNIEECLIKPMPGVIRKLYRFLLRHIAAYIRFSFQKLLIATKPSQDTEIVGTSLFMFIGYTCLISLKIEFFMKFCFFFGKE